MKRFFSVLLTLMLLASLAGCSTSSDGTNDSSVADTANPDDSSAIDTAGTAEDSSAATADIDYSSITLTILNSKSEIQEQFEVMAEQYAEEKGLAGFEVFVTSDGDSPYNYMQKAYASGDAPIMAMLDPNDINNFGSEKAISLSDESWVENGGEAMGVSIDGVLYSFPFCVEGRGLIYNKTAIEAITGEEFDYTSIQTLDNFKELCDQLIAGGMESPVTMAKEDWSLAGHYLMLAYEEQDFTEEGTAAFTEELAAGNIDLTDNDRFNSLMDTFDTLKTYNYYKDDPMSADYDLCASYLAEGEVAFWFNGNWAWAEISDYLEEGTEIGIMPVVQGTDASDQANTQVTASGSKQIMISNDATEEEQLVAKEFLDWLANDEDGQSFLVNDCALVPAFSNNTLEIVNQLSASIKQYVDDGLNFPGYNNAPGDHWSTLGIVMQKYLVDGDREALADSIESYWAEQ